MHISQKQLFLRYQAQTTAFPLLIEIERAEGCYLYDAHGKAYLDLISGIAVSNLGHGNKAVIEAIKNQADQYMHVMVYGEFVQSPQVRLARQLAALLPENLNCVYFVNSGSEATEGALKLAKRITGRSEIIAFEKAYHGSTHGALSLNSDEYFKNAYRPLLPGVRFLPYNQFEAISEITTQTACVILETVRGESGYATPDPGYLEAIRKRCYETGALLILDEIQCGMGRTGSLFAFEQYGLVPDILLLGKALGGGMPIGAFISSNERMAALAGDPILGHITTFGGHPVVCAAALAALNELLSANLMVSIPAKENLFRKRLSHPLIKSISGKGLMLALEFSNFEINKAIIDGCIADGLITDWFLFAPQKMRIAPPLIITDEEIEKACEIILKNCFKFDSYKS
ncbi:MAG: aspartate aminotransferase family protein [Bacteroidia bacterium]|jgi:acetylornithine/succinyldiaminopimelate/putrescine aminotransferase